MEIIERKEAQALGLKFYFTGKPCCKSHIAPRLVSNFGCYECHLLRGKSESARSYYKEWREKNRKAIRARHKSWREQNKGRISAYGRAYRSQNPEKVAELDRRWNEKNRHRKNAHRAKRRARIEQRTPVWADPKEINFFYECCPLGCHVDHIIPLKGRNISGLHVPENLQWLPERENLLKSNIWPGN